MRLQLDLQLPLPGRTLQVVHTSEASCWCITGPSGSGKSSLLRALAGVEQRARGRISIGEEVWQSARSFRPPWLRRVGWVPQEALLFPHLTVRENLRFGSAAVLLEEVASALEIEGLLERHPRHLSGGERQRVALGRALLSGPRLLLLDEPFSALDRALRCRVIAAVQRLRTASSTPAIIVSHDVEDLRDIVDVWLEVDDGRLVQR